MNPLCAAEDLIKKYEEIGYSHVKSPENITDIVINITKQIHLSDLQQWMLDTHRLWVGIVQLDTKFYFIITTDGYPHHVSLPSFENPSSALSAGLSRAHEIIKERQK